MKEEEIGLTEVSSVILKCGDCGTDLINVVVTETNEARVNRGLNPFKSRFKVVDCYKCKGSSFESEILEGSVVAGSVKDGFDIDIEDSDVYGDVLVNIIKLRKQNV